MNILITGSSGFIGRNLKEYLSGKYRIFAPTHKELDLFDSGKVRNYIKKNKIEIIVHGANAGGGRDTLGMEKVVENNLRMFFNIAGCEDLVEKIIHFGSGAEYDKSRDLVKVKEEEFDKRIPVDDYGFSKYVCSKFIIKNVIPSDRRESRDLLTSGTGKIPPRSHYRGFGRDDNKYIVLRLFGVYGKYEKYLFKFISNAIVKNLLKMPIVIGQNVNFDYLFIDDLVRIVGYFIYNGYNRYNDYNITSGKVVSLLEIAKTVNKISSFKSKIIFKNKGMNLEYSGDNSRLREEVSGFRFTPIEEGIKKLFVWYRKRLKELDVKSIKEDPYIKLIKPNII